MSYNVPVGLFVGELAALWLRTIRIRAHFEGGVFKGMRLIIPRDKVVSIDHTGLAHHDLIVAINGSVLDGPNRAFTAFERVLATRRIELTIRRGSQSFKLAYRLVDRPLSPNCLSPLTPTSPPAPKP